MQSAKRLHRTMRRNMTESCYCLMLCGLVAAACGCNSEGRFLIDADDGPHNTDNRFISYVHSLNPKPVYAVHAIRQFAVKHLVDLTDDETDIILNKMPVIDFEEDDMIYSFTWKIKPHAYIEVTATPPPCRPISAFRTTRVLYP